MDVMVDGHGYVGNGGSPVTYACILQEAHKQHLDPAVLLAVLRTENGRTGKTSRNKNGSVDIGPFQINSTYLADTARRINLPVNYVYVQTMHNGCFNAAIGAWVLRTKINAAKGDVWKGVAWYNSANSPGQTYRIKVAHKYRPFHQEF